MTMDEVSPNTRLLRFRVDVVYSRGPLRSTLAAIIQREGMAGPLVFLAATITELLCVTARQVALPGGLFLVIWQEVKPEIPWACARFVDGTPERHIDATRRDGLGSAEFSICGMRRAAVKRPSWTAGWGLSVASAGTDCLEGYL